MRNSVSLTPNEAQLHGDQNKDGQRRTAFELLSYPHITMADLAKFWPRLGALAPKIAEQIETDASPTSIWRARRPISPPIRRDQSFHTAG